MVFHGFITVNIYTFVNLRMHKHKLGLFHNSYRWETERIAKKNDKTQSICIPIDTNKLNIEEFRASSNYKLQPKSYYKARYANHFQFSFNL